MLLINMRAYLNYSMVFPSSFKKKSNNQLFLLIKVGLPWIIYAL